MSAPVLVECGNVRVEIPRRCLVDGLTFNAQAGEFIAVLGENGAGKTLTLHTLAGLRAPAAGHVTIAGRALDHWPRRELARQLALLTQVSEDPFPNTVLETAVMGRHPHIEFWRWESDSDYERARAALIAVGLAGCDARDVQTLSGGERRRVAVATVLTQEPRIFLLDEPTNHLDPHHQLEILRLFRARADAGCLVIASLHDPTLAAQFADSTLLLFGDGRWQFGASDETLTPAALSGLYHTPIHEIGFRGRRVFVGD
jgi:iron complex transport system ATP-binding protein